MPAITPLSGSGGIDEEWGDLSGGSIFFSFQHPSYISHHEARVIPFDTAGTGLFLAPPPGTTAGLQQEADNLAVLIAALYAADTTIAATFARQTSADHRSAPPYPFSFALTSTSAGTGGGSSNPVPNVVNVNSRSVSGARWRFTLPGVSNAIGGVDAIKQPWSSQANPLQAFLSYIGGLTNGPIHAVKTNLVTHNGDRLAYSAGTVTGMTNKRLRRHFGLV